MRILSIGTFTASSRGTTSISELLKRRLAGEHDIVLRSTALNRAVRMLDVTSAAAAGRFDVAHVHTFTGASFFIAEATSRILKARRKPFALNIVGGRFAELYEKKPRRVAATLRLATSVITPSRFLQKFLQGHGHDVRYVPGFIETEHFPFEDRDRDGHSVLWVRSFGTVYRPELAVDAIARLRESHPDVRMTMVGPDNGLLEETRRRIRRRDLDARVDIVGPVPNSELGRYYRNHAVYLNTTLYESFGLSIIEAALSGIPIVSTSVGEIPEIWQDGENAALVSQPDPRELAARIGELFDDGDLRARRRSSARQNAERFDWEHVGPVWRRLFDDLGRASAGR